jgi:hypothetical protein
MERFHIIDDGAVILRSKGLYRQAKVYRRGEVIYAGYGAGYIKLGIGSVTSVPSVSYDGIEADGVIVETGRNPKWGG